MVKRNSNNSFLDEEDELPELSSVKFKESMQKLALTGDEVPDYQADEEHQRAIRELKKMRAKKPEPPAKKKKVDVFAGVEKAALEGDFGYDTDEVSPLYEKPKVVLPDIDKEELYKKILHIKLDVDGTTIEEDMSDMLKVIRYDQLNPHIVADIINNIPNLQARWSVLWAESNRKLSIQKLDNEVWFSKRSEFIRKQMESMGRRATDKGVMALIMSDQAYYDRTLKAIEAEYESNVVKSMCTAITSKGEKLKSTLFLLQQDLKSLSDASEIRGWEE